MFFGLNDHAKVKPSHVWLRFSSGRQVLWNTWSVQLWRSAALRQCLMKPSGRSCAPHPSRRGRGSAGYCNGEAQGVENTSLQSELAFSEGRGWCWGFPNICSPLCLCLYRSSGRSVFHLKGLHRFTQHRQISVESGLWLLASVESFQIDRNEVTLPRPWGMWGWGWFGIWGWLRRKREGFTKREKNINVIFSSDIVKKHYLNVNLPWSNHRFNSITEGGPALRALPYTLRDSCCLDEILLWDESFFF